MMDLPNFSFKYILITLLLSLSGVSYAYDYDFETDGVVYVHKATITNRAIVDFIRERVFPIADYVIAPQRPYIQYKITFQKNPPDQGFFYPYSVIVSARSEYEEFPEWGYNMSIEKGNLYNVVVTFIDGRKFKVYTRPDNPYIRVENEKIRIDQKFKFSVYGGSVTWLLEMDGDKLADVCLDQEISPNIALDRRLRKDSYLLPRTRIEKLELQPLLFAVPIDSILPPIFIKVSDFVE